MSISELNKRMNFIKSQPLAAQKWLKEKIQEKGFWLISKGYKDG